MARNVFISFRYKDGKDYKNELAGLFKESDDTVDFSEDKDRSNMSEETIKDYLYGKLAKSSVTIVIITPDALSHKKDIYGNYDDWMYDEIRYSLEDRENNRTNGLIAVYVPEVKNLLCNESYHKCDSCSGYSIKSINDVDNLFRKNMMNVTKPYKKNTCFGVYDQDWDSYCSLIAYDTFKNDFANYIEKAVKKRENTYRYNLVKRL